ncbi:MAG: hypothetical protein U1E65_11830 [Myxococcota bacterium]
MRRLGLSLCFSMLLGCGAADPVVHLQIVPGTGLDTLDKLARVGLEVDVCDDALPFLSSDVPFRQATGPKLTLDLLPGRPFSIWLTGWVECTNPNRPSCQSLPGKMPELETLVAEGCSDWIVIHEGERIVPVTLTSTAGLCPAKRERCPAG